MDFRTGRIYHTLGKVKLAQGLSDESYEYFLKGLDHYKTTLGQGHHRTADCAVALGLHHARHGEILKAKFVSVLSS
jgi:hypothetical protein